MFFVLIRASFPKSSSPLHLEFIDHRPLSLINHSPWSTSTLDRPLPFVFIGHRPLPVIDCYPCVHQPSIPPLDRPLPFVFLDRPLPFVFINHRPLPFNDYSPSCSLSKASRSLLCGLPGCLGNALMSGTSCELPHPWGLLAFLLKNLTVRLL